VRPDSVAPNEVIAELFRDGRLRTDTPTPLPVHPRGDR
jgi:hypothetical protein